MNSVFGKAERAGDLGAGAMRALSRKPDGQALAEGIGIGGDAARFHGQGNLARAGDVHGEDMIRLRRKLYRRRRRFWSSCSRCCCPTLRRASGAPGFERVFGVGHDGQRFIFDFDGIGARPEHALASWRPPRQPARRRMHRAAREHRMRRNLHVRQHLRRREIQVSR